MDKRPIIAVTMGDPAGVGPEIAVKVFSDEHVFDDVRPVLVGNTFIMERACKLLGKNLEIHPIFSVEEAFFRPGVMDVFEVSLDGIETVKPGQLSEIAGDMAFLCVKKAIELAMERKVDGTVTNPLNKEALNMAGHHFSGHTEIYAQYTGTKKYSMMLAHDNLRVVHVSTHVSLREACDRVKKDRVLEVIRIADDACRKLGIEHPKVAVAGLNPHSGENGMFGREEIEEIIPAIEEAKKEGILADGPVPADTVFSKARGGWYDIVVCMYHDQGHIPLKLVGFTYNEETKRWDSVAGVNITLGLPIIRTSVDHGTAFDLAGTGQANEDSLKNAIAYAVKMGGNQI